MGHLMEAKDPTNQEFYSEMALVPCLRLRGGGGDGGSIPGRYDLVDIKKSIMCGNNKGRYSSFDHNSMVPRNPTTDHQLAVVRIIS